MDSGAKIDLDIKLRRAITSAIYASGKSREQIAQEISANLGFCVHLDTLNSWTADSKRDRRIPAAVIPALCAVLRDGSILDLLETPDRLEALQLGRDVSNWLKRRFPR